MPLYTLPSHQRTLFSHLITDMVYGICLQQPTTMKHNFRKRNKEGYKNWREIPEWNEQSSLVIGEPIIQFLYKHNLTLQKVFYIVHECN